jgi:tetratricopeptide (TPR) repeat protein
LSLAVRCFREAVTEHEKKPPDGALVQCLGCLARTLAGKGDCSGAEPFFKRTIEWYEACGASKDDERFSAMSDLAYCLLNMNRLDDAEVVASRCLVERAKKCGLGDSKVFGIMWILASIMEKQGRYEKALELFKQASEGMKETLGEQHEDTKTFQGDYIRLLEEKGNSASGNVARTHRKPDKICSIAKEDATAALKIDRVCDELVVCGNQDTVAGAEQDEKSFRLISVP